MDEQRLIDANNFPAKRLDPDECLCGRMYACGWNGVIHLIEDAHTIDPESLPIVQQLRAELAQMKAERDAAVKDLLHAAKGCDICVLCVHCCEDGKPKYRSDEPYMAFCKECDNNYSRLRGAVRRRCEL